MMGRKIKDNTNYDKHLSLTLIRPVSQKENKKKPNEKLYPPLLWYYQPYYDVFHVWSFAGYYVPDVLTSEKKQKSSLINYCTQRCGSKFDKKRFEF